MVELLNLVVVVGCVGLTERERERERERESEERDERKEREMSYLYYLMRWFILL